MKGEQAADDTYSLETYLDRFLGLDEGLDNVIASVGTL